MFSLYTIVMFILFVSFSLFLEHFFVFFEDLFLIIAFLSFISIVFLLISDGAITYFANRAEFIKTLYLKLFTRRKEAINKNIELLQYIYIKQDRKFIKQFAALVYLRYITALKLQKEIELAVNTSTAQNIFIEIQKELTNILHTRARTIYKK